MAETKQYFDVDLIDKDIITVKLNVLDFIPKRKNLGDLSDVTITAVVDGQLIQYNATTGKWENVNLNTIVDLKLVQSETPTVVSSPRRYKSAVAYTLESLITYINGQRIHDSQITKHSNTEFSYPIDIVAGDKLEISYIKS